MGKYFIKTGIFMIVVGILFGIIAQYRLNTLTHIPGNVDKKTGRNLKDFSTDPTLSVTLCLAAVGFLGGFLVWTIGGMMPYDTAATKREEAAVAAKKAAEEEAVRQAALKVQRDEEERQRVIAETERQAQATREAEAAAQKEAQRKIEEQQRQAEELEKKRLAAIEARRLEEERFARAVQAAAAANPYGKSKVKGMIHGHEVEAVTEPVEEEQAPAPEPPRKVRTVEDRLRRKRP